MTNVSFEEFFAEQDIREAVEEEDLNYVYIVWQTSYNETNDLTAYLISCGVDPLEYDLSKIYDSMYKGINVPSQLTIPDGVLFIESMAFMNCHSLQEITLPKSIKTIRPYAFSKCVNLNKIIYQGTLSEWRKLDKRVGIFEGRNGKPLTIECTDANYVYGDKQ